MSKLRQSSSLHFPPCVTIVGKCGAFSLIPCTTKIRFANDDTPRESQKRLFKTDGCLCLGPVTVTIDVFPFTVIFYFAPAGSLYAHDEHIINLFLFISSTLFTSIRHNSVFFLNLQYQKIGLFRNDDIYCNRYQQIR